MSALIAHSAPFSLLHTVQETLANLFQRPARKADPLDALGGLPDHVLLDIGIDPRIVKAGPALLVGNFDTMTGRRLSAPVRTAAKS